MAKGIIKAKGRKVRGERHYKRAVEYHHRGTIKKTDDGLTVFNANAHRINDLSPTKAIKQAIETVKPSLV